MQEPSETKPHTKANKRQRTAVTVAALAILAIVVAAIFWRATPKPSVAAYCKVYKEEKTRIAKLPGDTYPSLLFDHQLSDAGEFVTSLDRLEKVAPSDIRPDVHTLKSLYQKLKDDPSQMVSVSFAAEPVDQNASKWTAAHCKDVQ